MRKKILLTKQKNHEKDISILVLFMGFLFLMSTNVEAGDKENDGIGKITATYFVFQKKT